MIVAAQNADIRPWTPGSLPITPATVVLHVEPAGRVLVPRDFVHALAKLRVRIGHETSADPLIGRREGHPTVFTQIVAAGRDAEMHAIPVAQDRVHAKPAVPGLPFAG